MVEIYRIQPEAGLSAEEKSNFHVEVKRPLSDP